MADQSQEALQEINAALKRAQARKKRKAMLLVPIILIAAIAIALLLAIPAQPPQVNPCLNGLQDQSEEGIDCGGICARKCPELPVPYVDTAYILPSSVSDIAIDLANDRIYVLDEMRHRIMMYDSKFNHLKNFGESREQTPDGGWNYESGGTTNDKLVFPASIYAANGKVYVFDRVPRIQVFSKDLEYEKTLTFSDDALKKMPKLSKPPQYEGGTTSIVVSPDGKIYVSDEASNAVAVFDLGFGLIKAVLPDDPNGCNMPGQIALSKGSLLVADSGNGRIQVFDSGLNFVKSISTGLLMPAGVAVAGNGNILVFDNADSKLKLFDSEGKVLAQVGARGKSELQFYDVRAVKLDSEGRVYIVEGGNNRVQVLNAELQFEKFIEGIKRTFNVQLTPLYPAISPNGDIAFSDPLNSRVFILGSDFGLKKVLGGRGFGNDEFNTPRGITFDAEGKLFVSDSGNRRIQVFSPQYAYLKTIVHNELIWPLAISVAENGKVFVVDDKRKKVLVFSQQGSKIDEMGEKQGITMPLGVLAKGNKVYLTDGLHETIEVFDSSLKKLESITDIDSKIGAKVELNKSLALDGSGRLLFCDISSRKVIAYDFSKKAFSAFGDFGPPLEESVRGGRQSMGVAASSNLIVVANMDHHWLKVLDSEGKEIKEITGANLG